jgi:hypothetical protein
MASAPGVNFTNIFIQSFVDYRSQKCKNSVKQSVSFALLRSACIKTARKMLVKLTPGCDVLEGRGQDELLFGQTRSRPLPGRDLRPEAYLPEGRGRSQTLQTQ